MRVKNGRSSATIRRSPTRADSRQSVPRARVMLPAPSCRSRASSTRLRHLAQALVDEAPAVALGVDRLVGVRLRAAAAWLPCDPRPCGERLLIVRLDVGDRHAEILALDAAALGADRAVRALRADSDHAVAELDDRVVDHAVRALHSRGRNLAKPERALQEGERGADVRVGELGNDRGSPYGLDLLPDCRHERFLSPAEYRRLERGVAPQLPRQVDRLHCDLTLPFPFGSSSSRKRTRARLSRERTVPIGSSRASAMLWYESSSHAKSKSASRSSSGSVSMASATRGKSKRASSAAALARRSAPSAAAIRALARSRRASARRCFSNRFEPIPYSHGSAVAREASNVLRRSNAIRNSSPTSPSATRAPARRPRKRSTVAAWRS